MEVEENDENSSSCSDSDSSDISDDEESDVNFEERAKTISTLNQTVSLYYRSLFGVQDSGVTKCRAGLRRNH